MSGSELSSTFSETLVRVQVKGYVRLANSSGGPALVTFIWSADNPDGLIFIASMGNRSETWMFGHDLLARGALSHEPVGDGLVTAYTAVNTVKVTFRSPQHSEQWMRISVSLADVNAVLDAISARMLNAPAPNIEAEIHAWMDAEDEPC